MLVAVPPRLAGELTEDGGLREALPGLARIYASSWLNTAECNGTPGVDDDGNGYVDDCHGIDTINHDSNPMDDFGHGTHVSGIVGAATNNAEGVAAIGYNGQIMALKVTDPSGYISAAGGANTRSVPASAHAF